MNKKSLRPHREVALTIALLVVTISTAVVVAARLVTVIVSHLSAGEWRAATESAGFMAIFLLLVYGVLAYQIPRLGWCLRLLRFREADSETLLAFGHGGAAPGLTFLIPSYREEPRVIEQAILSAALQDYPSKRVVLLIDDPPSSADPAARKGLAEARGLGDRVRSLIENERQRASVAYLSFLSRGRLATGEERLLLGQACRSVASWLESLAGRYPADDHTNRHFVRKVLREPADALRAEAGAPAARELSADGIELRYRRLIGMLTADFSAFERKRYANLSHEPNKAMNINSYLALMGGTYAEEERGGKLFLVSRGDGTPVPETDYVAILDADSLLAHDYVLRLIHFMEQPSNRRYAVVQTPYSAVPQAPGVMERTAGATTDVQFVIHQGLTAFASTFWVGANAICRKRALDDIAARSTEKGVPIVRFIQDRTVIEDTESSIDLIAKGWKLYNYPRRLSYSATPPDFGSLLIQRRRWANGGLIILPKLIGYLLRNIGRTGFFLLSGLLRIHYLASIGFVNIAMLVLLLYPFNDSLLDPWMFVVALSYYLLYTRDLLASGYAAWDILRVYALNLLLIPVHLGGTLHSIRQAISGRRIPFARTPKVQGRTAAPPLYVWAVLALTACAAAALSLDVLQSRWLHVAFTGGNTLFFLYALRLVGFRNCIADIVPARAPRSAPAALTGKGVRLAPASGAPRHLPMPLPVRRRSARAAVPAKGKTA